MFQIDATSLVDLLPFHGLIPSLKEAFIAGATVPLRHTHVVSAGDRSGTSLLMPAWDEFGFYGVKIVNIFPGNRADNLPGLHSTYILHDARTGVPLAMLDGDVITSRRTAAAAALAASYLARDDASRLLVVGAGRVGSLVAPAMSTVRTLRHIAVWDIDPDAVRRCVDALREQGLPAEAAADLEGAVRRAHIVSCATFATAPLIRAQWLAPGTHLDLIGSFTPAMTEAYPACFADADVWIDTDEALGKSGDLLNALADNSLVRSAIVGDLAGLCAGRCRGRTDPRRRTVFKAVGTALEDLAAARLAYRQRQAAQAG
jgi:ornithine cyclodeaminase